jgi:undecaprenyl-diphosphatase
LIALAVNQPIVHAVNEARPYTTLPHILVLATRSPDASFPSDHATMAGAVAVGLWFVSRRLGVVAAVAAVLMAFTRVYIAAHYPADVAAGLLLGGVVAALTWLLVRRPLTRLIGVLAGTRLRTVLVADPAPQLS